VGKLQAIILAAGMGKRLKELTQDSTKCMIKVNGITLIERMLRQLDKLNLSRIIIVIGYQGNKLVDFIGTLNIRTPIKYINNPIYYRTNNIYSLYLAKDFLPLEDTLLLESDLILEDKALQLLLDDPYPSLALVAKFESWMDGTAVTLDDENNITRFISKADYRYDEIKTYYKTVNVYKFSKNFSLTQYVPFLEAYCKALGNNEYYEQVLRVIVNLNKHEIKALPLEDCRWYEIDDIQDLDIAESIFVPETRHKLKNITSRYGGYWRYPSMLDFCYLVNPYYPPQRMLDEMKASFEVLLTEYPSGLEINSLLASKYFGVRRNQIVVGNGAAELIKALMEKHCGKIGIVVPTFEEYPNRKTVEQIIEFYPDNENYSYTADEYMKFFDSKDLDSLVIINPDNPTGNYIKKADVLRIAEWAKEKGAMLIVDESFADFVDAEENASLFDPSILESYPSLVLVKSISKSFGVPGLRLGVIASGNTGIIESLKKDVAIWNINSFAEFFLQIFEKYKTEYNEAIIKFKAVRKDFMEGLLKLKNIRCVPTQANYIMCEILKRTANEVAQDLLCRFNILVKDLSSKKGIHGEFLRLTIRKREENQLLLDALKEVL